MYHTGNPAVIEGSDVIGLLSSHVTRVGGRTFAVLTVELDASKDYQDEEHALHVTDGVTPHLYWPSGEELPAPPPPVESTPKRPARRK